LPKTLSPSRAVDFLQCPRKFYEKVVTRRVVFQSTEASLRGTLTHHALEHIFDHPASKRTPANAVPYVRSHWDEISGRREQVKVANFSGARIESMLDEAEGLVREWFSMEDPSTMEPESRELEVAATLERAPMRGFIDRLDHIGTTTSGIPRYRIVDYKTGKLPQDRFLDQTLFPIHIYAAAIEASRQASVDEVQLLYIGKGNVTRSIDRATNQATATRFAGIWGDITTAAETGRFPCKTSPLCDWCDAKPFCPAWGGG
jgi:putative RecB family exonuclease